MLRDGNNLAALCVSINRTLISISARRAKEDHMLKRLRAYERQLKQWLLVLLLVLAGSLAVSGQALAGSDNGSAGLMPAFYDGRLFNINFKEQPATGESSLLNHNGSINTIYMCDQCESMGFMFVSVLDAIQGDGFNPLWREVQVVFLPGHSPRQLTS